MIEYWVFKVSWHFNRGFRKQQSFSSFLRSLTSGRWLREHGIIELPSPHCIITNAFLCDCLHCGESRSVAMYPERVSQSQRCCLCFFLECQLKTGIELSYKKRRFYHFTLKYRAERTEDSTLVFIFFFQSFGTRTLNNGFGWIPKLIVPTSIELSPQTFSGNFPSFISHKNAESF